MRPKIPTANSNPKIFKPNGRQRDIIPIEHLRFEGLSRNPQPRVVVARCQANSAHSTQSKPGPGLSHFLALS